MSALEAALLFNHLTEANLRLLVDQVAPLIRKGDKLFTIRDLPADLFGASFTWDAKRGQRVTKVEVMGEIETFHTYGYYGFFKPSIAEVYGPLSKQLDKFKDANAFEICTPDENGDGWSWLGSLMKDGEFITDREIMAQPNWMQLKSGTDYLPVQRTKAIIYKVAR